MSSLVIARALRAMARNVDRLRSKISVLWLKQCFPGLLVGRRVYLGAGTKIRVLDGATLALGDRTYIEPRCLLVSEGALTIGSDSFIGAGSAIVAIGSIEIGADALIAPNVSIRDQDHCTVSPGPYRLQGMEVAPIYVGANVWFGTNAVVLKGVTIGDDAVVAAAAVVANDVADSSLVAGVPARFIKVVSRQERG